MKNSVQLLQNQLLLNHILWGVYLLIRHTGIPVNIQVVFKIIYKLKIFRFMMIASPGLLKTLEEATGTNQVNKELALLVIEQVNNLTQVIAIY